MFARLHSILTRLPTEHLPPLLLSVGCGDYEDAPTILSAMPGWTLYGVDLDQDVLRRAHHQFPTLRLIQADAVHLPGLLRTRFGLILVRHPDLHLRQKNWTRVIPRLPDLLCPGGFLLFTTYTADEIERIRKAPLAPLLPIEWDSFAPPDLAGRDRFVQLYRTVLRLSPGPLKSERDRDITEG